jgi:DeoR/GlpR family transcriptional regulator of sugar metabolism
MLAAQRQGHILAAIRQDGAVTVSALTEELGVSDMTIRRDLEALASRDLVTKVHGGATAPGTQAADEPGFAAKSVQQLDAKKAIAAAARATLQPGMAIALTGGTTTWTFARLLTDLAGLTIVTNSLPVADTLHRTTEHTVIITGGERTPSDALVGPLAVQALRGLHVDAVYLGVHGLDSAAGLTTPNLAEAETNQAFIAASRRLVVLADHTKWGVVGLAGIAALSAVDVLITDDHPPAEAGEAAEAIGDIITAGDHL